MRRVPFQSRRQTHLDPMSARAMPGKSALDATAVRVNNPNLRLPERGRRVYRDMAERRLGLRSSSRMHLNSKKLRTYRHFAKMGTSYLFSVISGFFLKSQDFWKM